jgi:hypothetical protein
MRAANVGVFPVGSSAVRLQCSTRDSNPRTTYSKNLHASNCFYKSGINNPFYIVKLKILKILSFLGAIFCVGGPSYALNYSLK